MKTLSTLKLIIYAIAEVGLSLPIMHGLETGNVLLWFVFGFFLTLFNGAILSVAEEHVVITYR